MWRLEDSLQELILFFSLYSVGSRNQTQVLTLGRKCVFLSSHLASPEMHLNILMPIYLSYLTPVYHLLFNAFPKSGKNKRLKSVFLRQSSDK